MIGADVLDFYQFELTKAMLKESGLMEIKYAFLHDSAFCYMINSDQILVRFRHG